MLPSLAAADTPVSAVMTRDVTCVAADDAVDALEEILLTRGISGAPVVDELGRPVGMVSKTDLVASHYASLKAGTTVGDIMMPGPFCLATTESIAKAAGLMAFEGVHRVAVVGEDGRVVGIIAALDILRWLARESGFPIGNRR